MPKRFWSNSQKPKRLDQEHAIPSSFSLEKHNGGNSSRSIHSHSGSSSNSHGSSGSGGRPPLSSQGARSKSSRRKNKMEFGFDPWASPSPTSVAQIPTKRDSASNGDLEYYDQSREDEFFSGSSSNHRRSKSKSPSSTDHTYLDSEGTQPYQKFDHDSRGRDAEDTYGYTYNHATKAAEGVAMSRRRRTSRSPSPLPPKPKDNSGKYSTSSPQSNRNTYSSQRHSNRHNQSQNHIIPGVSKMTMRQMLSIIFSAYWDRADLYTDILNLDHDKPSKRQLKLAFFRAGRVALSTPIESPDDMTMLSAGFRATFANNNNHHGNGSMPNGSNLTTGNQNDRFRESGGGESDVGSTISIVQAGTPVSRKAKLRFQAISLAYELLNDDAKRAMYDEWRMWNSRLPPPPPPPPPSSSRASARNGLGTILETEETVSARLRRRHASRSGGSLLDTFGGDGHDQVVDSTAPKANMGTALTGSDSSPITPAPYEGFGAAPGPSASRECRAPSILRKSSKTTRRKLTFGGKKNSKQQQQQHLNQNQTRNRRISWNEEVEELTIVEDNQHNYRAGDMGNYHAEGEIEEGLGFPPYNALSDEIDGTKENRNPHDRNMLGFEDPYGPTAEDWFGTIDTDLPEYKRGLSKRIQQKRSDCKGIDGTNSILFEQASSIESYGRRDYSQRDRTSVNNFQSLGSRTIMDSAELAGTTTPSDVLYDEDDPDDSLMIILDGPYQHNRQAAASSTEKPDCSWTADGEGDNADQCWNDLFADSLSPLGSDGISRNSAGPFAPSVNNATANSDSAPGLIPNLPPNSDLVDDDGSLTTTDTYSTMTDGRTGDCDLGHTVDLARGFQASLSNYINAAVTDMKEGLQMMVGDQWDDLELMGGGSNSGEKSKNFFFLETAELDAMMSILKKEMDGISTNAPIPFGGGGVTPTTVGVCAPKTDISGSDAIASREHGHRQQIRQASVQTNKKSESKRFFGNLFSKS